jgi:hypothetical protein
MKTISRISKKKKVQLPVRPQNDVSFRSGIIINNPSLSPGRRGIGSGITSWVLTWNLCDFSDIIIKLGAGALATWGPPS